MYVNSGTAGPHAYETLSAALAGTMGALPSGACGDTRLRLASGLTGWTVFICKIENGAPVPVRDEDRSHPVWREIAATGSPASAGGLVLESHLALVLAAGEDQPARILVKSDADLIEGLEVLLAPGQQITVAELRLLKQMLCGVGLSAAAQEDEVSHETKRSQYKSLARKFGVRSQTELTSRVLPYLLLDGTLDARSSSVTEGEAFIGLASRYIPGARTFMLRAPGGALHRFIDIGPVSGHPVVLLHSQILSDFRPEDVALLEAAGIRLIVPLRHGAMAGEAAGLGIEAHMDHACEGIDLARSHFSGEKADLLACISGCAYGIEYAYRHPERVRSMGFLGACVRPITGPGIAGGLRSGLFALARTRWSLLSRALSFYASRLQRPATLWRFMRRHYAACPPDLAVVETEISAHNRGERCRVFFAASIESLKHDYYHQAMPRWERFPTGRFPAAFFHGAEDFIHPAAEICKLAQDYGGLPVRFIPGAGQLLYYDHFKPAMDAYTAFLASARQTGDK